MVQNLKMVTTYHTSPVSKSYLTWGTNVLPPATAHPPKPIWGWVKQRLLLPRRVSYKPYLWISWQNKTKLLHREPEVQPWLFLSWEFLNKRTLIIQSQFLSGRGIGAQALGLEKLSSQLKSTQQGSNLEFLESMRSLADSSQHFCAIHPFLIWSRLTYLTRTLHSLPSLGFYLTQNWEQLARWDLIQTLQCSCALRNCWSPGYLLEDFVLFWLEGAHLAQASWAFQHYL